MKICVIITTYDRNEFLKKLVSDIELELKGKDYQIYIFDDCSPKESVFTSPNIRYYRFDENNGKKQFWHTWTCIMNTVPSVKYYFSIQDDCAITKGCFDKAIAIWESIKDPKKVLLEIQADQRTGKSLWAGPEPIDMGNMYLQQWTDFMFLCEEKMFGCLKRKIIPISIMRWKQRPNSSSGVAHQITNRLRSKSYNMYALKKSLIKRLDIPSKMNPKPIEKLISI